MWSSPLMLSLSSVFALLGLALVSIAFVSDSWTEYQVNRRDIIHAMNRQPELNGRLKDPIVKNHLYFSRNFGLFHECFPGEVPSESGSFSKFGSPCVTISDYFPEDMTTFNDNEIHRLYLIRATVLFYILGLMAIGLCLIVGIVGCWKRSPRLILATALLLLFAVLFLAASMATWHYVNYLERHILTVQPYYRSWDPLLKQTTRFSYGWSYVVAWVGIAFVLFSAIFMLLSYRAIKNEEEEQMEAKQIYGLQNYYEKQAMVPYAYGGYPGAYGAYPAAYYGAPNYYGYMTYGR